MSNLKPTNHFSIPVFPQVKKFMIKNFPSEKGIYKCDEYNTLGTIVTLSLLDKRNWNQSSFSTEYSKDKLIHHVTIHLSADQMRMSPKVNKLTFLNVYINRMFKEHLITWVRSQYDVGIAAHPACKSFLEYYGLDPDGEEYPIDNAYKAWQRWNDSFKKSA